MSGVEQMCQFVIVFVGWQFIFGGQCVVQVLVLVGIGWEQIYGDFDGEELNQYDGGQKYWDGNFDGIDFYEEFG